jgi:flagellar motility protein MotE (MotC chaperone)
MSGADNTFGQRRAAWMIAEMVKYMLMAKVPHELIVAAVNRAEIAKMQSDASQPKEDECAEASAKALGITTLEYSLRKELKEAEFALGRETTEENYAWLKDCKKRLDQERSHRESVEALNAPWRGPRSKRK